MDLMLMLIIGLCVIILMFMGISAIYILKYYWLMFKTPAKAFKIAKKKGRSIMISYGDNGIANFEVSEDKDILLNKDKLVNIAPKSIFIEAKSKIAIASYVNSAGLSGQTMSPLFVALTQKIEDYLNKDMSKIEALTHAVDEQEKEAKIKKDYKQLLSLAHLKQYLKYNDAVGNFNTAHKIASVMFRKNALEIIKFVAILIGGAIACALVLGTIYLIIKGLQAPPDIFIQGVKLSVENVSQALSSVPVNASVIMP